MPYVSEQKIRFLTLGFQDAGLEREFSEDFFRKTIGHARFSLIVGIILYSIFGILDGIVIPDAKIEAWLIRYAVVAPYIVLLFAFSYSKYFKNFMQAGMAFLILLSGLGILAMLVVSRPPGSHLYYTGLILVIMFAYTFLKMRFIYGTIVSWVLVAGYAIAAGRSDDNLPMLVGLFFLASANFIGMFTSYQIELYIRRDFLQRRMIKEFEEKKLTIEKEKILKDLHDGVGGVATNIAMLAEMAQGESSLPDIKKTLSNIWELSQESVTEIRRFLQSLDVREMNWDSCVAELRYFGNHMLEPHGIRLQISSSIEDRSDRPGTLLFLNIFRIYKEAITNIVKHAGAHAVTIALTVTGSRLVLVVQDDGSGFAKGQTQGRGMVNMKMRAEELGGAISVTSSQGTRIELTVPLPYIILPH